MTSARFITLAWQTGASVFTALGMLIGSTTLNGALAYLAASICWFGFSFRDRIWGLMPLNTVSLFVTLHNLTAAITA